MNKKIKKIIGWREWVALPQLDIPSIKAKIDTGARTTSLHAHNLIVFYKGKTQYAKFTVSPLQRSSKKTKECTAKIVEFRKIKSSNGQTEVRPVIETSIMLFEKIWTVEITLTNRDEMGFRMLLGRTAIKEHFLIDASKSFLDKYNQRKSKKK